MQPFLFYLAFEKVGHGFDFSFRRLGIRVDNAENVLKRLSVKSVRITGKRRFRLRVGQEFF